MSARSAPQSPPEQQRKVSNSQAGVRVEDEEDNVRRPLQNLDKALHGHLSTWNTRHPGLGRGV